MTDLYDNDIVTWSARQAELLRRLAAGERINDLVDWINVVEEIESVGRSQVDAVESWLFLAFLHDLKAEAWPLARDVQHWRGEARVFRVQAQAKYRPSMRQQLDVAALYSRALRAMPDTVDDQPPLPVEAECPVTLGELLTEAHDAEPPDGH